MVETSYAYTFANQDNTPNIAGPGLEASGYPVSVAGQASWLRDIMGVISRTARGLGVFYWEPAWLGLPGCGWNPEDPMSGDAWENQALFDFDGQVLTSMDVFLEFVETEATE